MKASRPAGDADVIALRKFDASADRPTLELWLQRPHVCRWWGPWERNLAILIERPRDTDAVITAGGDPVGYLCWQTLSPSELQGAGLADLAGRLVDIDILIGDPACLGRGIAPRALRLLMETLSTAGEEYAGVGTSVSNPAAIRAFEKAGFRRHRDFLDPDFGPCVYLVAPLRRHSERRGRGD